RLDPVDHVRQPDGAVRPSRPVGHAVGRLGVDALLGRQVRAAGVALLLIELDGPEWRPASPSAVFRVAWRTWRTSGLCGRKNFHANRLCQYALSANLADLKTPWRTSTAGPRLGVNGEQSRRSMSAVVKRIQCEVRFSRGTRTIRFTDGPFFACRPRGWNETKRIRCQRGA